MPKPSIFAKLQDGATSLIFGKDGGTTKQTFYELSDTDMNGNSVSMSQFKGDVLCVVNVASK
jgi:hypothetical protein